MRAAGALATVAFLFSIIAISALVEAQPTWFTNTTNSTILGTPVLFSLNWTDNDLGRLGGYTFSFDNGTGTFVNDSFVYWGEIPHNSTDWRGGLVGLWHLNEGSGTSVKDFSSSGYNGTLAGGPSWITNSSAKFGNSVSFDGDSTNDYIGFGNVLNLERTDKVTISFWMNPSASDKFVIAKQDNNGSPLGNGAGWYVFFTSVQKIQFSMVNDGNSNNQFHVTSSDSIPLNSWSHVVITKDGTSDANGVKFYINGTPVGQSSNPNNLSATTVTAEEFRIGCREDCTFGRYVGLIDELAIWNRNMTETEAKTLYNMSSKLPTQAWSNATKVVNLTSDSLIRWRVYANDASTNTNTTDIFTFRTRQLVSMLGGPLGWTWGAVASGSKMKSGTPYDWTWRTYQSGSGRKIPNGDAYSWTWQNE